MLHQLGSVVRFILPWILIQILKPFIHQGGGICCLVIALRIECVVWSVNVRILFGINPAMLIKWGILNGLINTSRWWWHFKPLSVLIVLTACYPDSVALITLQKWIMWPPRFLSLQEWSLILESLTEICGFWRRLLSNVIKPTVISHDEVRPYTCFKCLAGPLGFLHKLHKPSSSWIWKFKAYWWRRLLCEDRDRRSPLLLLVVILHWKGINSLRSLDCSCGCRLI
jgi:hypothetical protein